MRNGGSVGHGDPGGHEPRCDTTWVTVLLAPGHQSGLGEVTAPDLWQRASCESRLAATETEDTQVLQRHQRYAQLPRFRDTRHVPDFRRVPKCNQTQSIQHRTPQLPTEQ